MERSVSLFNLRNLEIALQRNLRTGTARKCIFRASGGTRFKNSRQSWWRKGTGGTPRCNRSAKKIQIVTDRCLQHEDGHRQKLQYTHYNSINSNHMFVTRGIFNCTSGLANFYTSVKVHFVKFTFKIHFRSTWHARRLSLLTSNKIGHIVSERAYNGTEQLQVIHTFRCYQFFISQYTEKVKEQ